MKKSFRFVFVIVLLVFILAACAAKDEKRENLAKLPIHSIAAAAVDFEGKGGVNQATFRYLGCNSSRGEKSAKNGNQLVYARFTVFPESGSVLKEDEFKTFILENVILTYNKKGVMSEQMELSDTGNAVNYPIDIYINQAPLGIFDFEVMFETPEDPKFFGLNVVRSDRIDQTLIVCQQ